ncbi:hypothetical protein IAT38_005623 [Cryptococcus sp. DSM 104549]
MTSLTPAAFAPLFGLPPSSPRITSFLASLTPSSSASPNKGAEPDVKTYPDVIYHNYYSLGLSLCFDTTKGLESVDIYNTPPPSSSAPPGPSRPGKAATPAYSPPPKILIHFPSSTMILPANPKDRKSKDLTLRRPLTVLVRKEMRGREFVRVLGEPGRKGSGSWVGVWLEWPKVGLCAESLEGVEGGERKGEKEKVEVGLMLDLQDPGAGEIVDEEGMKKGMGGVWERAAGWEWKSLKVFRVA